MKFHHVGIFVESIDTGIDEMSKIYDIVNVGKTIEDVLIGVKIVTLGCALERITFVHFVEQRLDIPYRYLKKFSAQVTESGITKKFDVSYFVRDLEIDAQLNLASFEYAALRESKIIVKPFGRFKAKIISSKDFFEVASQMLMEDQYALVRGTGS